MKEQTYIAYIKDYNDQANYIAFERFSCRRAETVRRNMEKLFNDPLYRAGGNFPDHCILEIRDNNNCYCGGMDLSMTWNEQNRAFPIPLTK